MLLRRAYVNLWLLTWGEALQSFLWENYSSILVCTKLHNKEQRKAHSPATTATSGTEDF